MTRENKLALVIGFGLILFVGILISDHFSLAQNQESADLAARRAADPLFEDRHRNARLFDVSPARAEEPTAGRAVQPPPVAVHTGQINNSHAGETPRQQEVRPLNRDNQPGAESRIVMGQPATRVSDEPGVVFHYVQQGESLYSIANHYYGDGSLYRLLAPFNDIDDPGRLRANHRLRIPPADRLRAGGSSRPTQSAPQEQRLADPVYATHTMQRGETLSEIAQRLLGSARRWREIHELNRDVIRDPNNVPVGTELKIPRP